jgi:hypothetical protein
LKASKATLLLLVLASLGPSLCSASIAKVPTLEELVDEAPAIAVVKADGTCTHLFPIRRDMKLEVMEYLKGPYTARVIFIRLRGGEVGPFGAYYSPASPTLREGETYVVFLTGDGFFFTPYGDPFGVYLVKERNTGTEAVVKTILEDAETDFEPRVPGWSFTDLVAPLMLVPDYAYMLATATLYGIYLGTKRPGIRLPV